MQMEDEINRSFCVFIMKLVESRCRCC